VGVPRTNIGYGGIQHAHAGASTNVLLIVFHLRTSETDTCFWLPLDQHHFGAVTLHTAQNGARESPGSAFGAPAASSVRIVSPNAPLHLRISKIPERVHRACACFTLGSSNSSAEQWWPVPRSRDVLPREVL
jgi:hypothetical protein